MSKIARMYKIKKSKLFDVDNDLLFNSFDDLPKSIILTLYDDKTRTIYKFRISDLINIISTALTYAPSFFSEPQTIKNPYTNIEFTKAQLYTIYYKIKSSSYNLPTIFHFYFLNNFNLLDFRKNCDCYIREKVIDDFVINGNVTKKHKYILQMFEEYNYIGIVIDKDFPKKTLVNTFNSYIIDYLTECYSFNNILRTISKKNLKKNLKKFKTLNPKYGRKIYKINKKFNINNIITNNTNLIIVKSII